MHRNHRFFWAALFLCCLSPALACAGMFSPDPLPRTIASNPAGAKVYYSPKGDEQGVLVGTTPYNDTFDPDGKYPAGYYRFEKEGYKATTKLLPIPSIPAKIDLQATLQPITTIRLTITSKPGEAMILFGTDKNNITKQLGPTPYKESKTDAASDEKPVWEKGYYKALLTGYRPKVVATEQTSDNLELNFDLEPLPQPPAPPKVEYPDAKTVAYRPVSVDAFKNPDMELSNATPIAIMTLKDSSGKDVASMIADSMIMKLQRKGYVVLEREIVEKAINDLNNPAPAPAAAPAAIPGDNPTQMNAASQPSAQAPAKKPSTSIELIKELSEPLKTRYFLIGTLNEYISGKEEVAIVPSIPDAEKQRYQKEYDAYLNYFKSENMPLPQAPKTLQEWDLEFSAKTRSASMNVARVGITAKVLDVKTGKAVWTGIVNIQESGLQKALNKVVDSIVDSIADKGEVAGK